MSKTEKAATSASDWVSDWILLSGPGEGGGRGGGGGRVGVIDFHKLMK